MSGVLNSLEEKLAVVLSGCGKSLLKATSTHKEGSGGWISSPVEIAYWLRRPPLVFRRIPCGVTTGLVGALAFLSLVSFKVYSILQIDVCSGTIPAHSIYIP